MQCILVHSDIWSVVSGELARPEDAALQAKWKSENEKALAMITLCVKPSQLDNVKIRNQQRLNTTGVNNQTKKAVDERIFCCSSTRSVAFYCLSYRWSPSNQQQPRITDSHRQPSYYLPTADTSSTN